MNKTETELNSTMKRSGGHQLRALPSTLPSNIPRPLCLAAVEEASLSPTASKGKTYTLVIFPI